MLLLLVFVTACDLIQGEEVARIPINKVSKEERLAVQEISLELKEGDRLSIWSEMDVEYEGPMAFRFRIDIFLDGENLGLLEFDPTEKDITVGEVKTDIMGKVKWKFSGRNKVFLAEKDGNYTFKGILISSNNATLKLNKAEVVFRE